MRLFKNTGKAKKKWRRKAWLINPGKTKITIVDTASRRVKHMPPWIYNRELDPSIKELFTVSNVRKEYCDPLGLPSTNSTEIHCDTNSPEHFQS
jgi:hypothetical protein